MNQPSGKIDRIHSLIRRALHPKTPAEEARTSAMIALQQALDAGLFAVVGMEDPYQKGFDDGHSRGLGAGQLQGFNRGFEEGRRKSAEDARHKGFDEGRAFAEKESQAKLVNATRKAFDEGFAEGQRKNTIGIDLESFKPPLEPRRMIGAKFRGMCKFCGAQWMVGDVIAWNKQRGATCRDCKDLDL